MAASAVGEIAAAFRSACRDDRTVTFRHDRPNFTSGAPALRPPRMIAPSNVALEQAEEVPSCLPTVCPVAEVRLRHDIASKERDFASA